MKFTAQELTILREALKKLEQSFNREKTAKPMFAEIVEKQLSVIYSVRAKIDAEK